jgi:F-type H+-transporting ATPase subunit a
MHLTPDQIVLWRHGFLHLNATILYTWIVMALLVIFSSLLTRNLTAPDQPRSRWRNGTEVIVEAIRGQVRDVCGKDADEFLPFIGTVFLFIAAANVLDVAPAWHAPTGSLSTTAALAISVGVAVPLFGVRRQGIFGYFKHYLKPTPVMLPLHLLSETSRNLALALRLFGNMMSEGMILAVLFSVAPFFFPILMQILGLVTGMIQAYIFAILATVYIAAAVRRSEEEGIEEGS